MIITLAIIVFALSGLAALWGLWMFIDWAVHGFPQRFK